MTYPSDLPTVTVTHTVVGTDGRPMRGGSVRAIITERVWTPTGSILPSHYDARINADGQWVLELPPVDHPDMQPAGAAYRIEEQGIAALGRNGKVGPDAYYIAPVMAHGPGPIDASQALVTKPPAGGGVTLQTGPVTDEAAAKLLDKGGQFATRLSTTIGTEVEGQVPLALAKDNTVAVAAAAAAGPAAADAVATEASNGGLAAGASLAGTQGTRLWEPPAQPSGSSLVSWTGQQFLDLYEAMRTAHPEYVTRQQIGSDAEGQPIWAYYFTPAHYENTALIFNQHGAEKVSIFTVARFMKLLVDDWASDPRLAALRARTRVVVVPFVSWHSVGNNSRKNANGVDLNRNWDWKWAAFPSAPADTTYKGTAPFSEPETRALRDLALVLKPQGLTFALDAHDTGEEQKPDPVAVYAGMPDRELGAENWFREVVNHLVGPSDPVTMGANDVPKACSWLVSQGVHSVTVEYEQWWGTTGLDAGNQTGALRIFGNAILEGARQDLRPRTPAEPIVHRMDFRAGTSNIQVQPAATGHGEEIGEFRYEFYPPCAGVVQITGEILLGQTLGRYYVTPTAGQLGTAYHPTTPQGGDQLYADAITGATRPIIPFSLARAVVEDPKQPFTFTVFARTGASAAGFIYAYSAHLLFIPSGSPGRFLRLTASGRGGQGVGAMQPVAGI